jgi:hypothetical protein
MRETVKSGGNILQLSGALRLLRPIPRFGERRQQKRRKDGDHRDGAKQFK